MGIRSWGVFFVSLVLLVPVATGRCFGASFTTPGSNYKYRARLNEQAASTCDLSNTNVTALYMLGSCCRGHRNNFGPRPPPCGPGDFNVMDSSAETCAKVFSTALPPDLRFPKGGEVFDAGAICSDGLYSVIFIQTDCDALTAASVVLDQKPGGVYFCWSGHTMSQGRLAGIIVGSVAGAVLLVALPVAFCLWRQRRQQRKDLRDLEIGAGPSTSAQQPQILKVADSVFVSKQHALRNPFYASALQEEADVRPYDIELLPANSSEYESTTSLPLAGLSWTTDKSNDRLLPSQAESRGGQGVPTPTPSSASVADAKGEAAPQEVMGN